MYQTANGTTYTSLQLYLATVPAKVQAMAVQEHKLTGEALQEHSAKLKALGWTSVWSHCLAGIQGKPSAGVAIWARSHLDFCPNRDHKAEVVPGRICWAPLRRGSLGTIALYSVYMYPSEGMGPGNRRLLRTLGCHMRSHGLPSIAAADWQMEPSELGPMLEGSGIGLRLVADEKGGTCANPRGRDRCIDYFLVDERLYPAVGKVEVVWGSLLRPHRPVDLTFRQRPQLLQATVQVKVQQLPAERPVGPRQPGPAWDQTAKTVRETWELVRDTPTEALHKDMGNEAYAAWQGTVVQELASVYDMDASKLQRHGLEHTFQEVPMAKAWHTKGSIRAAPSRAYSWVGQRLLQLASLLSAWGTSTGGSTARKRMGSSEAFRQDRRRA